MVTSLLKTLMPSCTRTQLTLSATSSTPGWGRFVTSLLHHCNYTYQFSLFQSTSVFTVDTTELTKKLQGAPVEIRVMQNKEPDHFLLMFKGKLIIHSRGSAAAFKARLGKKSYVADGASLFQVRGTNDFNLRAIQVPEKASSLNSNDCFVLECPSQTFIWYGKVRPCDYTLMMVMRHAMVM